MISGYTVKLGDPAPRRGVSALALISACFLTVGVGRVSMLFVLPFAAAIGVFCARREWL